MQRALGLICGVIPVSCGDGSGAKKPTAGQRRADALHRSGGPDATLPRRD
jgi:hypothetical protein